MSRYCGEVHDATRYRNIMNLRRGDMRQGGEAHLFQAYRGSCYGYVHLGRTDPDDDDTIRRINVHAIGGQRRGDYAEGVHVIWIASRLKEPGVCIVGDYRDATVYHQAQPSIGGRRWGWNISAPVESVRFIAEHLRVTLNGVSLRQANLWYAKKDADAVVRRMAKAQLNRLGVGVLQRNAVSAMRAS